MSNALASATSPYLRQHADNPVHWQEWSAAALAEAARRDVPILLSVGYAACHWCHVMAHGSFDDAEVRRWRRRRPHHLAPAHRGRGGRTAPIFFGVDTDIDRTAWNDLALPWFCGINSVIGEMRTGVYGGINTCQ